MSTHVPCWIVWVLETNGPHPQVRAIDTTFETAEYHRKLIDHNAHAEDGDCHFRNVIRVWVEPSLLDHLFASNEEQP